LSNKTGTALVGTPMAAVYQPRPPVAKGGRIWQDLILKDM